MKSSKNKLLLYFVVFLILVIFIGGFIIGDKNREDANITIKEEQTQYKKDANNLSSYEKQQSTTATDNPLTAIVDAYEHKSKYPLDSQPVADNEIVNYAVPYEFNKSQFINSKNISNNRDNPTEKQFLEFSISTESFVYVRGEIIRAKVEVYSNQQILNNITVAGRLMQSGQPLTNKINFYKSNAAEEVYTAEFDTTSLFFEPESSLIILKVSVNTGEENLTHAVQVKLENIAAEVEFISESYIQGANLIIPLNVNVAYDGTYSIRGVLKDAGTGQNLIRLQQNAHLVAGRSVVPVKAHISALKYKKSEGPYTFTLLEFTSYPSASGAGDVVYAPESSFKKEYQVNGFAFDEYIDEEYVDPVMQERLRLLQGLSQESK